MIGVVPVHGNLATMCPASPALHSHVLTFREGAPQQWCTQSAMESVKIHVPGDRESAS